jgi:hypothetical protein
MNEFARSGDASDLDTSRGAQQAREGGPGVGTVVTFMLSVQHTMNPLHIYCRLMDLGLGKRISLLVIKCYEHFLYQWLIHLTTISIALCRYKPAVGKVHLKKGKLMRRGPG